MTSSFLNQTGTTPPKSSTFNTILDTLKFGVGTWSDSQRRQAERDTADAALKLEALKLQALRQEAANAEAGGASVATAVKSYAVPIAVTGVVVALGIAAYFYFKKKKA